MLSYAKSLSLNQTQKVVLTFKYILVFLLFFVLCFATINYGYITPFAFGLYFALLFLNFNVYVLSALYLLAYSLSTLSLSGLYIALNVVAVGLLVHLLHTKTNTHAPKLLIVCYALFGSMTYIYFNTSTPSEVIAVIISSILSAIFTYSCLHFLHATLKRGFAFKLNLDEVICGSVIIIAFSCGLSALNLYGIEFVKMIGVLAILMATYMFANFNVLFVSSLIGIGAAIYTNNINYVATFVCYGLLAKAFKSNNKIFSCIAICLVEVLFGLYFKTYTTFGVFSLVSILMGEILFLLMPTKVFEKATDILAGSREKVAIRSIVNHSKEGIYKRMNEIASVFNEMDIVFRNMVKGVLSPADAKKMLTSEVIEKCCLESPEITRMFRVDAKMTTQVFENIIEIGFEKGKVTLLDSPQYITSKVGKINYIINLINQLLASYKHYAVMVSNMDGSRVLIAEQLSGVSSILKNLANEVKLNISFDLSKENQLIEELTYKNIFCLEAIVYEQTAHIMNATLVLRQNDYKQESVEKTVSKVLGSAMKIVSCTPSSIGGCVIMTLKTKSKYDIIFGSAGTSKAGEVLSGDTHSLIRIDDTRYMVALSDGMGSGKRANSTSSLSISLIENFYKAGFDSEIILNSVNKLLGLNNEENFSALDICVIDIRLGMIDFIKMASPYGYIKHKNTTEVIETNGLPIGVLDEMKPHITKKVVLDFDIIILLSDGVVDSFDSQEELTLYINNLSVTNPQVIADEILDRAVDNCNGVCNDDMTVIAVKVYPQA